MAHSFAELELIRAENRRALGMAGYSSSRPPFDPPRTQRVEARTVGFSGVPGGILGAAMGSLPPIRVGSAFPDVEYTIDAGDALADRPPTTTARESGTIGPWLNRHVFRPFAEVGGVRYAPGDGFRDFSGVAKVVAVGFGIGIAGTVGWILLRAFGGSR